MLEPSALALFAAALAVIVVPGPSVLYVVAQSLGGGRKAGLVSTIGIAAGALVHVAAATIGLSSLLASSAQASSAVRYAGAAYLVYLGVRTLAGRDGGEAAEPRTGGSLVVRGALVEALNPKTALFFLAFLPQFVDPAAGSVALQLFLLGAIFVLIGLASDGAYALLAGAAAGRLQAVPGFRRARRFVSGGALVGLGAAAAFAGHDRRT